MCYANYFLTQLLPNKAKKVRYAPPANASQISEGHFSYLDFAWYNGLPGIMDIFSW